MGIFTRFRDIISSNINAILDRAEDPEKMVQLMILEMEDTLVEIRGACAGVIAEQKKLERQSGDARAQTEEWEAKAKLAVKKGREDMAREALLEKRRYIQRADALSAELERVKETVRSFQDDTAQLEAKLQDARDKQRSIIQRHAAASAKRQAQERIRRADTSDAFAKFEAYENHIDRMEAEAGLVNSLRPGKGTLRDQFSALEQEDEIEEELRRLRGEAQPGRAS